MIPIKLAWGTNIQFMSEIKQKRPKMEKMLTSAKFLVAKRMVEYYLYQYKLKLITRVQNSPCFTKIKHLKKIQIFKIHSKVHIGNPRI